MTEDLWKAITGHVAIASLLKDVIVGSKRYAMPDSIRSKKAKKGGFGSS
jgi:hypothetical protein